MKIFCHFYRYNRNKTIFNVPLTSCLWYFFCPATTIWDEKEKKHTHNRWNSILYIVIKYAKSFSSRVWCQEYKGSPHITCFEIIIIILASLIKKNRQKLYYQIVIIQIIFFSLKIQCSISTMRGIQVMPRYTMWKSWKKCRCSLR